MARQKKAPKGASNGWITTYSDMVTLMMCFFVMLYDPTEVDITQLASLSASIKGDPTGGAISLSQGRLADLGNTVNSMPSAEKGQSLATAKKKAVTLFAPDVKSNRITITSDERGLVISLASDTFFRQASADLNMDEARDTLMRIAQFLASPEVGKRKFRIEGHTDNTVVTSDQWPSNWELSTARATNVLHYLSDFGVAEKQFSVAGYADTQPKYANDTAEGRAYNRRVDIIILDEGHF